MKPKVSILVITRNRAGYLAQTLESFAAMAVPADLPTELILVDNGSSDETPRVIEAASLPI